jgi:hypothetical protein
MNNTMQGWGAKISVYDSFVKLGALFFPLLTDLVTFPVFRSKNV